MTIINSPFRVLVVFEKRADDSCYAFAGFDPSVGSVCSPFSALTLTNWKSIYFPFYGKIIFDFYLYPFVYNDLRYR
jgi:hypothetical protein